MRDSNAKAFHEHTVLKITNRNVLYKLHEEIAPAFISCEERKKRKIIERKRVMSPYLGVVPENGQNIFSPYEHDKER